MNRRRRNDSSRSPLHFGQLAAAGLLADGRLPLALLGVGGEAVPPALWTELQGLRGTDAYNFYGPTECTVDTIVSAVRDTERPVIGRPVDGTNAYVLDDGLAPVAAGRHRPLYLSGSPAGPGLPRPADLPPSVRADPFGPPGTLDVRPATPCPPSRRHDRLRRPHDDQVRCGATASSWAGRGVRGPAPSVGQSPWPPSPTGPA